MPWVGSRGGGSRGGGGGGVASSNWSYLTEEIRKGPLHLPRANEIMYITTAAKAAYKLTTQDLGGIEGFRRPATYGGGNTLTMYYMNDLVAAAVRKHGQHGFDTGTPAGRPWRMRDIARHDTNAS